MNERRLELSTFVYIENERSTMSTDVMGQFSKYVRSFKLKFSGSQ